MVDSACWRASKSVWLRRPVRSMSAVVAGDGRVTVVRGHDLADQLRDAPRPPVLRCANAMSSMPPRMRSMVASPGARHGQVHLRHVAGDDHRRVEAQTGQEHLHLLFGGVLRLVEDHERVVQRAAAHVGERRHFDGAVVHVPLELVRPEHVSQARRTAGADTGRPCRSACRAESRGFRPPPRPGCVRMMRRTCLSWKARTAFATARYVLPVPAGPMPKVMVCDSMAFTYVPL